jgi:predicted RNase H-like nuclease (RuvC/YqgF family)
MATREAVWEAAEHISGRGEYPTAEKVRGITGGSYTTINPLLDEWARDRLNQDSLASHVPQMPDEMAALWARVWSMADRQHAAQRMQWSKDVAGLYEKIAERDRMVCELEAELELQADELEQLEKQLSDWQHLSSFEKIHGLAQKLAEDMLKRGTGFAVACADISAGPPLTTPDLPAEQA